MNLTINTKDKQFVQSYLEDCEAARKPAHVQSFPLDGGSSLLCVDNICLLLDAGDSIRVPQTICHAPD